jgi:AcrR family transcriptional regulator
MGAASAPHPVPRAGWSVTLHNLSLIAILPIDDRTQRQASRSSQIVDVAWGLARDLGGGGFSLRQLALEVGIRQPSLYAHFDSKHALYDAMFADGYRRLIEHLDVIERPKEPRVAVRAFTHAWVNFAIKDPARYALLFQRPIPGYAPSAEAYSFALSALGRGIELMRRAGVTDPGDVDCCVAMVGASGTLSSPTSRAATAITVTSIALSTCTSTRCPKGTLQHDSTHTTDRRAPAPPRVRHNRSGDNPASSTRTWSACRSSRPGPRGKTDRRFATRSSGSATGCVRVLSVRRS